MNALVIAENPNKRAATMKPFHRQQPTSACDSQRKRIAGPARTRLGFRRSDRRGAAAVEFAIVAPVFLLMILGMIELGRALMVQQVLINASRVGARQAVTLGATSSAVESAVQTYASSVAVPGVSVTVSPSLGTAKAGDTVTVTTSVGFSTVSWLPSPWFLAGKTLTATSKMRKEGFE